MSWIAALVGRLLIALLFIVSGFNKIIDPAPAGQMMQSVNLPGNMAMGVGIFEIVAGLLLAIGLMTRLVSIVLAAYVALTIFFFHHSFATTQDATTVLMHLALLGGLLLSFAYGHMRGSYDWMRERRRTYDAELRAARAEGKAEGATTAPRTVVNPAPATVVTNRDGEVIEERPKRRWF